MCRDADKRAGFSTTTVRGASCKLLCDKAVELGHSAQECHDYMQQQRQVCMYLSEEQTGRISTALQQPHSASIPTPARRSERGAAA